MRSRGASISIAVLCLAMAATPIDGPTAGAQARPRPNIVVIVTDDQRIDMMSSMPEVQRDLVAEGMSFSNAFVNDSLCCPSRISILRGQLAHTTRIYGVSGPFGGYGKVKKFGLQSSTLATWLGDAGYRTAMIGKYMNLYTSSFATEVPAGWDYWAALVTTTPDAYYYGYQVSFSTTGAPATTIPHGTAPADYSTRVYSSHAQEFVTSTPADQPLFLYFAPTAPHMPATADPIDTQAACTTNPELPSFGEADVSDKPAWVRSKPWSVALAQSHRARWVKQCRSLLSVDRAVGDLIDTLAAEGRLEDTLFVYTSDNGLFNGEHRLDGKKAPYEESIHVPLIVRYDGVTEPGSVDDHLVMNIDIAPTALTYAGVSAPSPIPCSSPCVPQRIGGRSLAPLLDGTPPSTWRTGVLIEHYDAPGTSGYVPPFCAIRTPVFLYVRYDADRESRRQELYDMRVDPFQLVNRAKDPAYGTSLENLRKRLRPMCVPTPPDYAF